MSEASLAAPLRSHHSLHGARHAICAGLGGDGVGVVRQAPTGRQTAGVITDPLARFRDDVLGLELEPLAGVTKVGGQLLEVPTHVWTRSHGSRVAVAKLLSWLPVTR